MAHIVLEMESVRESGAFCTTRRSLPPRSTPSRDASQARRAAIASVVQRSAPGAELSTRAKKEQSASERFQQFSDVKTSAWHAARHVQAQLFLPTRTLTLTLTTCRRSSSSQP